jgi:16S rRNA (cytidine1402-2'-O)-methyltransferase
MLKMNGKIYLVATPIGNLEDITLRALRILKEVDLIAAEDTRHTLGLLNHFEISKPLISYYKQNEKTKSEVLIQKALEGQNIAVVSDAGTPGISDPGEEIVKKAIENNIEIVPIPGACAFVNALIASGLNTREFCFIGFLSAVKKEKKEKLEEIKYETKTIILYEAPHKLKDTLELILEVLGDRNIVLAKEITKIHEEYIRDTVSNIVDRIDQIKGEFVILIEGSKESKKDIQQNQINEKTLEEHYKMYEDQGFEKKDIIKKIAKDRNVSKNEIYQYFLK